MLAHLRRQTAFENPADKQCPFHRVGCAAGKDHLFDLGHQAGRVDHVRYGRKQELCGERLRQSPHASSEREVLDRAVVAYDQKSIEEGDEEWIETLSVEKEP